MKRKKKNGFFIFGFLFINFFHVSLPRRLECGPAGGNADPAGGNTKPAGRNADRPGRNAEPAGCNADRPGRDAEPAGCNVAPQAEILPHMLEYGRPSQA